MTQNNYVSHYLPIIHSFIHSITIAPLQVHYYSEALLTQHVIVILISRFLKRYSKAKRTRAPAYSRVLRRIKGGFSKEGGQEKLRSDFQNTTRGQSSC